MSVPYSEALEKFVEAFSATRKCILILAKLQEEVSSIPFGIDFQTVENNLERALLHLEPQGVLVFSGRNQKITEGHIGYIIKNEALLPQDEEGMKKLIWNMNTTLSSSMNILMLTGIKDYVSQIGVEDSKLSPLCSDLTNTSRVAQAAYDAAIKKYLSDMDMPR
jgi:hypothetical protein